MNEVSFVFEGERVSCPEGMTVAGALFHLRSREMRTSARRHEPRSLFCGMGVCFDCVLRIDGVDNVRSCMTPVRPGIVVERQHAEAELGPAP